MTPALLEETYTWNTGVPIVEGGEFINNVDQSRDIFLSVVVHDLLGSNVGRQGRVADELLVNEAREGGQQRTIGNCRVAGAKGAVEFQIIAGHGVIRVIENGIEVLRAGAIGGEAWVSKILGVTIGPVVDGIVEAVSRDAPEYVVEGTVLQNYPHNILDLRLKVLDRRGGAGSVAKRSRVDLAKGRAGCRHTPCHGANGEDGEESSRRLHTGLEYRIDRILAVYILGISHSRPSMLLSILRRTRQSFM